VTRTVGVEEEFLLVDRSTGEPRDVAGAVLRGTDDDGDADAELTGELQREQLETGTRPCRDLHDLHDELRRTRAQARDAARATGVELAPLATSPLPVDPTVVPSPRYERMIETFGHTGAEQLTCGCHVHVSVGSEEEGVAALDGIRPWLAPLLALSANSPFWNGADTGYASFRSQLWGRWPSAGPTGLFGTPGGYREVTDAMLSTGTILDEGMLYFDARLSRHHPTVEIRVADVCREPADTVLIAALTRALVETAVRGAGTAPDPVRTEVLRLAAWRAGRSGTDAELLDPRTWKPAPAGSVVDALIEHVAEALQDAGDLHSVRELADAVLHRGTGAARQRAVFARTGELRSVVADATM
jgi:carboxylate-amine ligase